MSPVAAEPASPVKAPGPAGEGGGGAEGGGGGCAIERAGGGGGGDAECDFPELPQPASVAVGASRTASSVMGRAACTCRVCREGSERVLNVWRQAAVSRARVRSVAC